MTELSTCCGWPAIKGDLCSSCGEHADFEEDTVCSECGEPCDAVEETFDYAGTHCTNGKGGTHHTGHYVSKCCLAELEHE